MEHQFSPTDQADRWVEAEPIEIAEGEVYLIAPGGSDEPPARVTICPLEPAEADQGEAEAT